MRPSSSCCSAARDGRRGRGSEEEAEIQGFLARYPGWERRDGAPAKTFQFPSFRLALAFVDQVADLAEAAKHHPDMLISYRRVQVTPITHEADRLTEKDLDLARRTEETAPPTL